MWKPEDAMYVNEKGKLVQKFRCNNQCKDWVLCECPYGQPGDVLWVRETWIKQDSSYKYLAENTDWKGIMKFKPSIHMPKAACRLFLQIKSIRVERLQDITEEDAKAEGVKHVIDKITGYCGYDYLTGGYNLMTTPYHGFRSLWKKINGEESWNSNPWVWVITFKQIPKPTNFQ